jgi:predicted nucleic acid-binding protein
MEHKQMKVYLDTSSLNRVFDDQSQPRIYLEASAMIMVFAMLEEGLLRLVSSEVLVYENEANPFAERRSFVTAILEKAEGIQKVDEQVLSRAQQIEKSSAIIGVDALHLACAEKSNAVFLTCDDKILKRYSGKLRVMNPVDFAWHHVEER